MTSSTVLLPSSQLLLTWPQRPSWAFLSPQREQGHQVTHRVQELIIQLHVVHLSNSEQCRMRLRREERTEGRGEEGDRAPLFSFPPSLCPPWLWEARSAPDMHSLSLRSPAWDRKPSFPHASSTSPCLFHTRESMTMHRGQRLQDVSTAMKLFSPLPTTPLQSHV